MVEVASQYKTDIEEVFKNWKLGVEFDQEGYENLGYDIKFATLKDLSKLLPHLSEEERKKVADKLFPIKLNGN